MEVIYEYLSGSEFHHRVEAIVEDNGCRSTLSPEGTRIGLNNLWRAPFISLPSRQWIVCPSSFFGDDAELDAFLQSLRYDLVRAIFELRLLAAVETGRGRSG
jgi:hypothetical protein